MRGRGRGLLSVGVAAAAAVAMSISLHAQWLKYPTGGIPRTPDGKPNLSAPPPRTADGKPDLSGLWEPEKTRPCPPDGCEDMPVGEQFLDIGWRLKGGLPYQKWAADLVKARMEQNGKDDPGSHCLPTGILKMHTTPLFRKIVQVPGLVVMLYERNTAYRQIFTDGRPLPAEVDLPSYTGFSSATWEGDTLVVHTSGIKDGLWLDRRGSPMTDAARVTERIRRVSYGQLEIDVTVDDPKAYTAPWTIRLNQFIVVDTELLDYVCLENERDIPRLVGK